MQFKINAIEGVSTSVTFTFDDGTTLDQNIANLPIGDEGALAQALTDYANAYIAGLAVEAQAQPVKTDVSNLIGKTLVPPVPPVPAILA